MGKKNFLNVEGALVKPILLLGLGINFADEKGSKKTVINSGNIGDSTALQNIHRTRFFPGPDVPQSKATKQLRVLTTCRFV
jgi:hypothetical protein